LHRLRARETSVNILGSIFCGTVLGLFVVALSLVLEPLVGEGRREA